MSGSLDPSLRGLNDCGCCEGTSAETPARIDNRPGLSAVAYRVGTHGQFKETMLARFSSSQFPALADLKTRDDSDFTVALLDAWASVADVIAFYQERIANESYLRTATERVSLQHLARLVGYEPAPGVAAGVHLAFTVDDVPGAPFRATVDAGVKVQSIPGPGETLQTYETVETIEARAAWNAMRPRLTQPQEVSTGMASVLLRGIETRMRPGDVLLIVEEAEPVAPSADGVKRVVRVVPDPESGTTRIDLTDSPPEEDRSTLFDRIFGDDFPQGIIRLGISPLNGGVVSDSKGSRWGMADLGAQSNIAGWPSFQLVQGINFNLSFHSRPSERTALPRFGVFAMRQRASLFGHNAPSETPRVDGEETTYTSWPDDPLRLDDLDLDSVYPEILPGSWLVAENTSAQRAVYLVERYRETSRADYTLSAKVSRLQVTDFPGNDAASNFTMRSTTVFGQSEPLDLAETPIGDPVAGNQVLLDRFHEGLKAGQSVILTGEREDLPGVTGHEALTLTEVLVVGGYTKLVFRENLAHAYVRKTVSINANVARATHGETVHEVLGGGDATRPFQEFTLKQSPLTYTSSADGALTSLEVRVNDLLWEEVPTFYGRGPEDRVYVVRTGDDGKTIVKFGDGVTGQRLPTGPENVRATYRKGIGLSGLVKAGQLSLLATRPYGIRSVANPLESTGAGDREGADAIRGSAPLTALTMDRVVSLRDYEDYARAFPGMAKALATWTWFGQTRGIFLTVAGAEHASRPPADPAQYENSENFLSLVASIRKHGDPHPPFMAKVYRPAFFQVEARIAIDAAFLSDKVLDDAKARLRDQFSFARRSLGQPVSKSEVIAVLQATPGVVAVDLDRFFRSDRSGETASTLVAAMPLPGGEGGAVLSAELLTLDPRPIRLDPMTGESP